MKNASTNNFSSEFGANNKSLFIAVEVSVKCKDRLHCSGVQMFLYM